ncbi:MAG: polysaccharide deacetylase family protein [Candidatus Lokiarchaeota archaeon]|nr:polysaccharide deacetylase family protein [Candidatus Lokiarchaeota archaeon]
MSDQKIKNIIKLFISYIVYYSGLFYFLNKIVKRSGLIVFNYHNFNTFTNDYWKYGSVFESEYRHNFEKQIVFIKKHVGFIHSTEIENQLSDDSLRVIFTFDDGYKDNYEIAFPILKKHGLDAIFFITTKYIGTKDYIWHDRVRVYGEQNGYSKKKVKKILREMQSSKTNFDKYCQQFNSGSLTENEIIMLSWNQIREISDAGFKVCPHTYSHTPLNYLSFKEEFEEINESRVNILSHVDKTMAIFSVPNGKYSSNTQTILKSLEYEYCFSIMPGINNSETNKYLLKRNPMSPCDPVPVVALKLLLIKLLK